MTPLLEVALSNVLMAGALALLALSVGRLSKRPALRHSLWLLVLLKLITPPVVLLPLPWPAPLAAPGAWVSAAPVLPTEPDPVREPEDAVAAVNAVQPEAAWPDAAETTGQAPLPAENAAVQQDLPVATRQAVRDAHEPDVDLTLPSAQQFAAEVDAWSNLIGLAWLAGCACWFVVAAVRLRRFSRCLVSAVLAPAAMQAQAGELARRLGLKHWPQVWLVPGALSPMLWVMGRTPRLLLPHGLMGRLSHEQRATLLAHELAHWYRRDHWVRWLELVVLGFYWWCPLAWWARRELSEAEEDCCDAWVVWALPDSARAYATALVDTLDFLSGVPRSLPLAASAVGPLSVLRRRLTMILRGRTPRALPRLGLSAVIGLGLMLLPLVPTRAQSGANEPGVQNQDQPGSTEADKVQKELDKLQKQLQDLQDKLAKENAGKDQKKQIELEKLYKQLKDVNDKFAKEQKEYSKQVKELHDQIKKLGGKVPPGMQGLAPLPGLPGIVNPPPIYGPPPTAPKYPATPYTPAAPAKVPQPATPPAAPNAPQHLEQRVKELEKKVEMLLKELQKKHSKPGSGQSFIPGTGLPAPFAPGSGAPAFGAPLGTPPVPAKVPGQGNTLPPGGSGTFGSGSGKSFPSGLPGFSGPNPSSLTPQGTIPSSVPPQPAGPSAPAATPGDFGAPSTGFRQQ